VYTFLLWYSTIGVYILVVILYYRCIHSCCDNLLHVDIYVQYQFLRFCSAVNVQFFAQLDAAIFDVVGTVFCWIQLFFDILLCYVQIFLTLYSARCSNFWCCTLQTAAIFDVVLCKMQQFLILFSARCSNFLCFTLIDAAIFDFLLC